MLNVKHQIQIIACNVPKTMYLNILTLLKGLIYLVANSSAIQDHFYKQFITHNLDISVFYAQFILIIV